MRFSTRGVRRISRLSIIVWMVLTAVLSERVLAGPGEEANSVIDR